MSMIREYELSLFEILWFLCYLQLTYRLVENVKASEERIYGVYIFLI